VRARAKKYVPVLHRWKPLHTLLAQLLGPVQEAITHYDSVKWGGTYPCYVDACECRKTPAKCYHKGYVAAFVRWLHPKAGEQEFLTLELPDYIFEKLSPDCRGHVLKIAKGGAKNAKLEFEIREKVDVKFPDWDVRLSCCHAWKIAQFPDQTELLYGKPEEKEPNEGVIPFRRQA